MKLKYVLLLALLSGSLALVGCVNSSSSSGSPAVKGDSVNKIVVYKSPNCGCCVKHIAYLESYDYEVETITTQDMISVKEKYGIPRRMESCHTAIIDGYVVEGHVPMSAIRKLLDEKPDIDGIALPEMPAGSPGMPGFKTEPFVIYALEDGQAPTVYLED